MSKSTNTQKAAINTTKKVVNSLLLSIILLIISELLLQVRSHLRFGQSVFNAASNETTYQINHNLNLKLLRPNSKISGSQATIETNSLGLRSPELTSKKENGEFRVAIVGASTVMGTYTPRNEDTLSYRLEYYLNNILNVEHIKVINAGIAGSSLEEQKQLIEKLLLPLEIDYLVLYTGFNDISRYCNSETNPINEYKLSQIQLPSWLLSTELIRKNTVWIHSNIPSFNYLDPSQIDTSGYMSALVSLLSFVKQTNIPMTIMTNARSFRKNMPIEKQLSLSETARFYNDCFNLAGLHEVYDIHNKFIINQAKLYGFHVFNTEQFLPGGAKYFGDATHFTKLGTDVVASHLAKKLINTGHRFHSNNQPVEN
ncbi:hypothetical protein [Spartinivicinus ruber]|uniref:hypothetical protein n=1 Tax=Spartinivicinus ruber TaxID=2683272 RepID=UPI0013D2178F|nr:hypothetical protein [Spartinivicinus ruber]